MNYQKLWFRRTRETVFVDRKHLSINTGRGESAAQLGNNIDKHVAIDLRYGGGISHNDPNVGLYAAFEVIS